MVVGFEWKRHLIIGCMLCVQGLFVPKTMMKCLILLGTANHTGMMMPLSLQGSFLTELHSYPWFIFPFMSIDHSDCKNHSFIKAGLTAFVLVQLKFTKCTFVTLFFGSSPLSLFYNLIVVMWQGWILWVTAVWLPLLTRDKGSGRIFTAIYLPLIISEQLCLCVFYLF